MARLVAYLIWLRHFGFFHTAQPPLTYTGLNEVIAKLEAIPQTQPLPLILYRRISSDPIPAFNGPLVKALRKGNGFCVGLLFRRSQLDIDLLGENSEYFVWAPEDNSILTVYPEATKASDKLTRWLRGGVGWIKGPKPCWNLADFMEGFEPKWRRQPLTPEQIHGGCSE